MKLLALAVVKIHNVVRIVVSTVRAWRGFLQRANIVSLLLRAFACLVHIVLLVCLVVSTIVLILTRLAQTGTAMLF